MMIEDKNTFYESEQCNDELSLNGLKKEFEEKNMYLDEIKMKNLGLINSAGKYTKLAYILSDNNTQSIKLAIYNGNDKNEFLHKKEFEHENIFKNIKNIMEYFELIVKRPAKIIGVKRFEMQEYDLEVIREILINSVTHKDYSFQAPILISVYKDYIEFSNIGGLFGDISVEAIKKGSSLTRNPKLVAIFHRLGYIEAYGSGIPRVFSKYLMQKEKPTIESIKNTFFVKIPKLQYLDDEELNKIRSYLSIKGQISIEKIEEILYCTNAVANEKVNEYVEYGMLKQTKKGDDIYYEL